MDTSESLLRFFTFVSSLYFSGIVSPPSVDSYNHTLQVLQVILPCMCCPQLYLTLFYSTDCSPPGSSVSGIFQARILEWVTIFFSRGSSRPRDQTQVFYITTSATWEAQVDSHQIPNLLPLYLGLPNLQNCEK